MKKDIKKILEEYKVFGAKQDLITEELCVLFDVVKSDSERLKIPKTTKEQRVQLNEGYKKK